MTEEGSPLPLQALTPRTETLATRAYDRMCTALLDGTFRPGDRLVMDRLADELGVSRTPVREVLQRLERERVIRPTGSKGYEVCVLGDEELNQMYQAREAVEGYATSLVAKTGGDMLDYVERQFADAARMPLETPLDVYRANRAVHRSVIEATGNRHMVEMFDLVWSSGLTSQVWADLIAHGFSPKVLVSDHAPLLDAMRSGSASRAAKAATSHIREGRKLH